jgi:hypothetical protein
MDLWGALVVLRRHWLAVTIAVLVWLPGGTLILRMPPPMYGSSGSIAIVSPKNALKWLPHGGYDHPRNPLLNFTTGLPVALDMLMEQMRDPSIRAGSALLADGTNMFSVKPGGDLPLGDPNSPIMLIDARASTPQASQAVVQQVIDLARHQLSERQSELGVSTAFRVQASVVLPPTDPVLLKGSRARPLLSLLLLSLAVVLAACRLAEFGARRGWIRRLGPSPPTAPLPGWVNHHLPARRLLDGAAMTGLFVIFLTVIPARLVPVGLPAALSLASLVGLVLCVGWLCSHLVHHLGMAKGWNPVRAVVFCYALTQVLTYGYATGRFLPFDELHATDHTVVTVTTLIAVALAVCDSVRSPDRLHLILKIVVCGATFMAAVGVIQSLLGLDLTRYLQLPGLHASFDDSLYSTVLSRDELRRPAGTAGHPIEYGAVCTMVFPVALYYALRARLGALSRLFWVACAGLLLAGVALALSRSAMICFGVVTVILLIGWPLRRTVLTLASGAAGFLVLWLGFPTLSTALTTLFTSASSDTSILARTRDYDTAFVEAGQHLWLGRGLGTWLSTKYNVLDNQYLLTLLENGVVGVVAFLLLFLVPVVSLIRLRSRLTCRDDREFALTLIAALSVNLIGSITYDSLSYTIATGLSFVLIGTAGAALRICREQLDQPLNDAGLSWVELSTVPRLPAAGSDRPTPAEAEAEEIYDAEIVEVTPAPSD